MVRNVAGTLPEHYRKVREGYRKVTGTLPEGARKVTGSLPEGYRKVTGRLPALSGTRDDKKNLGQLKHHLPNPVLDGADSCRKMSGQFRQNVRTVPENCPEFPDSWPHLN